MCFENLCLYKFILETSPHSIHISSRLQRATRTHKQTYLWTGQRNTERKENTGNQSLVLLSSSKHWQANEMKWNLAYNTFSLQIRAKPSQAKPNIVHKEKTNGDGGYSNTSTSISNISTTRIRKRYMWMAKCYKHN